MRKEKFNFLSQAQKVFKNAKLLNERPAGMTMEEYRAARKMQTRASKMLFPSRADQRIANVMRPKQKSEHHQLMVKNARFIKYGNDITEEVKENKVVVLNKPSLFKRFVQHVRRVFNQNQG